MFQRVRTRGVKGQSLRKMKFTLLNRFIREICDILYEMYHKPDLKKSLSFRKITRIENLQNFRNDDHLILYEHTPFFKRKQHQPSQS